jgi:hypothetical protein
MHRNDDQGARILNAATTEEDTSRRELLGKIGRFAYVAPALTLLSEPGAALGQYRTGGGGPPVVIPPPRPRPRG